MQSAPRSPCLAGVGWPRGREGSVLGGEDKPRENLKGAADSGTSTPKGKATERGTFRLPQVEPCPAHQHPPQLQEPVLLLLPLQRAAVSHCGMRGAGDRRGSLVLRGPSQEWAMRVAALLPPPHPD